MSVRILLGTRAAASCVPALLLAALLPAGPASAAEISLYWSKSFDLVGDVNDRFFNGGGSSSTALSLVYGTPAGSIPYFYDNGSGYSATMDGIAGGTVSYGHISGSVSAIADGNLPSGAGTDLRARFLDTVTIVNPALTGQPGLLTATVLVHVDATQFTQEPNAGAPGIQAQTNMEWLLNALGGFAGGPGGTGQVVGSYRDDDETAAESSVCDGGQFGVGAGCEVPAPATRLVPVSWSFTFGSPFELGLEFYALAGASAGGGAINSHAEASLDFLNTVAWQGISSVSLFGETGPVDFSISSESGTDYSVAATAVVPAPAGLWLLGTGIASLGARRWLRAARP